MFRVARILNYYVLLYIPIITNFSGHWEDLEKAYIRWEKCRGSNDLMWECINSLAEYVKECRTLRREITDGMGAANTSTRIADTVVERKAVNRFIIANEIL
ncbi:hypothetical protein QA601_18250 [Chitinispirillales bacterium ANBcel5]|uniref:hypothetical protein n=1 Tax=Cellulosispirillum alkaliphilum TaxID=3039283 RepID=UPI002A577585|nr:hypothetical protein [Chitinispirillales bacterium ANBcel5]